jgi:hypothetical protein
MIHRTGAAALTRRQLSPFTGQALGLGSPPHDNLAALAEYCEHALD